MAATGQTPHQRVLADLVSGLLDGRDDPATARFDDELEHAVELGSVSPESAHRLRYWQRAAVRSLAEHVRTAVPGVLGLLAQLDDEARVSVEQLDATLGADPQQPPVDEPDVVDLREVDDTPSAASPPPAPTTSTLESRARLILADLVTAPAQTRPEHG